MQNPRPWLFILCCLLITNGLYGQNLKLEFIGKTTFKTGRIFKDVELGGLSGISYDESTDTFISVSDDYSNRAPARFYKLKIDLSDGMLQDGDIEFMALVYLKTKDGKQFQENTIDPEGIASFNDKLFVSSEGQVDFNVPPFIAKFNANGDLLSEVPLPQKFMPKGDSGIRNNKGFESLAVTPDQKHLFTANEEPLAQDETPRSETRKAPVRIMKYALAENTKPKEFLYNVGPLPESGLVEIIPLNEHDLLTLERSYIRGKGNFIQIYKTDILDADDISNIEQLKITDFTKIKAAEKTLLLDLRELGLKLDNFEGMCFGPVLPDGRQSLVLVSDNNFNEAQATHFFSFAVSMLPVQAPSIRIAEIQGAAHTSPYVGKKLQGIGGIITALSSSSRNPGFWMQSTKDDGKIATSQGIFVENKENEIALNIGDSVRIDGLVEEVGRRNELTLTQIKAEHIEQISSGNVLPEPVIIGVNGRKQPTEVVDDDSLKTFDPLTDAIDFYESLEGMRVQLENPVVVEHKNRFGEMVVVPERGEYASGKSQRGGILLTADDFNPERLFLIPTKRESVNPTVGDYFDGKVSGTLFYAYGNFKVIATDTLPRLVTSNLEPEKTHLAGDENHLTVASYNVYNLGGNDQQNKFDRIAKSIVENLNAPDILALQEVQDNDGSENTEIVDASHTLNRLIASIKSAGGPAYNFSQINPADDKEGGQPGGNIRVAFLYNHARVNLEKRGQPTSESSALLITDAKGLDLSPNPCRIFPKSSAFERSRVPLVAKFEFNGHVIFIINNHLRSKGGDNGIFGAIQPPVFYSEEQRNAQAEILSKFVQQIYVSNKEANVIVLGDMNEHEFRRPIQTLKETPLYNLTENVPQNERYTYIYQGNSQVLDHIFVSKNLHISEPETDIVHINSEFPTSQRASDHDPIMARFKLSPIIANKK